jgi:hypothetical protein
MLIRMQRPLNIADGCAGIVAGLLANQRGSDTGLFEHYALEHIRRVPTPIIAIVFKSMFRKRVPSAQGRPVSALAKTAIGAWRLRREGMREVSISDKYKNKVRRLLETFVDDVGIQISDSFRTNFIDDLLELLEGRVRLPRGT